MMSILDALAKNAQDQPNQAVWTFLNDHGDVSDSYTYQELEDSSSHLAESLLSTHSLNAGDRILLVFYPGLDFTVSLLACFKAGLIGVPVFPPDPRKMKKDLHHFVNIQLSCGAKVALTNSLFSFAKKVENLKNIFSKESAQWPDLKWILVDDSLKKGKTGGKKKKSAVSLPNVAQSDIAFLQYTSGSTSDPKGVMISHINLAHNLTLIISELKADRSTVNVSWLPQYHDMGLIGSYMGVVYCGGSGYYLSPISFLKNPVVWIQAMSRYKGTHTQAPNFAYPLVSRKFAEAMQDSSFQSKVASKLDLSSLRHMINAAEPVDYHAIMEFYRTFGEYGLPGDVVVPTYGLAEHTVFVCSGGKQVITVSRAALEAGRLELVGEAGVLSANNVTAHGSGNGSGAAPQCDDALSEQRIVGCGYPGHGEGVQVLIVNTNASEPLAPPSTGATDGAEEERWEAQPEGIVGEIWVSSQSKAQGYWNQPTLSQREFHAPVPANATNQVSDVVSDGFLRTGDLGFMYNSELFICGRVKDLIIVRGSNHYPQDIERTAEQHQGAYLRAGCSAAFSLGGTEKRHTEDVIYVAELKEGVPAAKHEEIARAVKDVVSTHHGLSLTCVCLLKTRSVPKTTSGKIARSWCRRGYVEKTLMVVYRLESSSGDVSSKERGGGGGSGDAEAGVTGAAASISASSKKLSGGYSKVHTEEGAVEMATVQLPSTAGPALSAEQVRQLPIQDVVCQLEVLLIQVAQQGPSPLTAPVDRNTPVSALGLDSMTVVQYKGVIEKRFHCDIPDDFLFTPQATLEQLALAVHEGKLTDAQKAVYEEQVVEKGVAQGDAGNGEFDPDAPSTVVMSMAHKQPCCPWFTCCL